MESTLLQPVKLITLCVNALKPQVRTKVHAGPCKGQFASCGWLLALKKALGQNANKKYIGRAAQEADTNTGINAVG